MEKAIQLLKNSFAKSGKVDCSAIDTDEGTRHLWGILETLGYAEKNTKSGRGIMGHNFSYKITEAGERVAQS